jgi:hypothetical protein
MIHEIMKIFQNESVLKIRLVKLEHVANICPNNNKLKITINIIVYLIIIIYYFSRSYLIPQKKGIKRKISLYYK